MWSPILLLAVIWSIFALLVFYVITKSKKTNDEFFTIKQPLTVTAEDKEKFQKEIDALASYVSKLPRPNDVIQKYRNEENDSAD